MDANKLMTAVAALTEAANLIQGSAAEIATEVGGETEPEAELDLGQIKMAVVCSELKGVDAKAWPNQKRPGQTALSFDRQLLNAVYGDDLDAAAAGVQAVLEANGLPWVGDKVFAHVGGSRAYTNVQSQDAEAAANSVGACMASIIRARQIAQLAGQAAKLGKALGALTTEIAVRI